MYKPLILDKYLLQTWYNIIKLTSFELSQPNYTVHISQNYN